MRGFPAAHDRLWDPFARRCVRSGRPCDLHGRALAERAAGSRPSRLPALPAAHPDAAHALGAPAADRHRRRGVRGGRQLRHRLDATRLRPGRDRCRDPVAHLGDRGAARRPSSRRGRRHGAGARRGRPFGAAPARHRGARRARHGHRQRAEGRGRRERRQPADRPRAGRPAEPDRRRDGAAHRCRRADQPLHRRQRDRLGGRADRHELDCRDGRNAGRPVIAAGRGRDRSAHRVARLDRSPRLARSRRRHALRDRTEELHARGRGPAPRQALDLRAHQSRA